MFQVIEGYRNEEEHWEKPIMMAAWATHQEASDFAKDWIGGWVWPNSLPDLLVIGVRYYYCNYNYLVIVCKGTQYATGKKREVVDSRRNAR